MKKLYYARLTLALCISAGPAFAQSAPNGPMPETTTAGTGYIGGSVFIGSEYLGSADQEVLLLPYLSFENVKGFDLLGTALSYRVIETGTGQGLGKWSLRAGPSVTYQQGRNSDDSANLSGFEDIGGSFVAGGYVRSTIGPVGLLVDVGKDIAGGHDGLVANASIGTFYRKGPFAVQPSFTVSWADNPFNDSFFSVSQQQAATSPLGSFDAGSGIYKYSAGLVSWIEFRENYALSLIGTYDWYINDAADSPIVNANDGSRNGIYAAVSLSRKFDTNKW